MIMIRTTSATIIVAGLAMIIIMMIIIVLVPFAYSSRSSNTTADLSLIGERFFENGTGLAYFDNGTTRQFNHTITPENGFYYDNSTVFLAGDVPGVSERNSSITAGESNGTNPLPGSKTVNITIPYSSELVPGDQTFQPNLVRVKVGDNVTWINDDRHTHSVVSPPPNDPIDNRAVAVGLNFDSGFLGQGQTFSFVFTRPGGFHYADTFNPDNVGTVIVEEE